MRWHMHWKDYMDTVGNNCIQCVRSVNTGFLNDRCMVTCGQWTEGRLYGP